MQNTGCMLLQNLMEEKQLDFNRPLLSIRRASSAQTSETKNKTRPRDSVSKIPPLPVYKSDIKSGPVRNPGTVPFQWEHRPGKPKVESKSDSQGLEQPHFVPKLPPGRTLNVKQQEPGRRPETGMALHIQTGSARLNSQSVSSLAKNVRKYESAKDIAGDAKSSSSEYYDDEDDDDGDAYMDANDTLSRSESFFLNCSVSGVSALDGPELQPSGIFSSDPQTRDFMMGRFLPAAKAMASETPPHPTRKPPIPQEQLRPIKVMLKEKRQTVQRNPNDYRHVQYQQEERWEESDDEDESDRPRSTISGACGLLPQICLKSSFGLLNPVPAVRMQAQRAVSVRRLRSKYPDSRPRSENENKHARGARNEPRSTVESQKMEIHEDKIKLKPQMKQSPCGTKKLNGSVLQAPSQGEALSVSSIPEVTEKIENFHVSANSSHNKVSKNFGELLASDDNGWESWPGSPVVEKTLYVDTVHMVKSPKTDSGFSDAKGQGDSEDHPLEECLVKDVEHLHGADEKATLRPRSPEPRDGNGDDGSLVQEFIESRSLKVVKNQRAHPEDEFRSKQCLQERSHNNEHAIIPLPGPEAPESRHEKTDLQESSTTPESSNGHRRQCPVPPPLPKAPSDSWLKRTLPTISSKNSLTWSSLGTDSFTKIQALQTTHSDPKWETMVKTSNTWQGLTPSSKEKLFAIPEA